MTTTSNHTSQLRKARAVAVTAMVPLAALLASPLIAQQTKAQLAFGYHCDNKFALRNEGTRTTDVDYKVVGTSDRGRITVKPRL